MNDDSYKINILLEPYWAEVNVKIKKARYLSDLIKRKHRVIRITNGLSLKVDGGHLSEHRYNRINILN
ncbi:hypothetical protein PO80_15890 [Vibrio parahaemolyticus]|nr:hypothetical protein PO80_15890 [Vibrio parahaemolyticus]OTV94121.1 hypothetical protein BA739_24585 [Vibrio parahaemolyticus]OTV97118.1 hypothetical protein BA740_24770 [Vibrio parahaemolyticus]